jgi:hypothetical protein
MRESSVKPPTVAMRPIISRVPSPSSAKADDPVTNYAVIHAEGAEFTGCPVSAGTTMKNLEAGGRHPWTRHLPGERAAHCLDDSILSGFTQIGMHGQTYYLFGKAFAHR